jgi:hypothetical protein
VTTVEAGVIHDWRLVAPWWDWPLRGTTSENDPGKVDDRRAVRVSRPVFQMYDSADLVNVFLTDPQRRLEFDVETDEVWDVEPGGFGTMPSRTRTHRRKLFLASHHRHYLFVASMHCDAAGFPSARTDEVCETGLVVRRRCVDLPGGPKGDVARAMRRHAAARSKRADLERRLAASKPAKIGGGLRSTTLEGRLRSLRSAEQDAREVVVEWLHSAGQVRHLEGWVPTGVDASGDPGPMPACGDGPPRTPLAGRGSWQQIEELPEELTEGRFPLSALIPDPTRPAHDATGETIYFGVVPTGSSDVDDRGNARFDEYSSYEIRCFVRRHLVACPRSGGHCRCPVTWSEPTEVYQLASHFDLEGTANRPVTVQLPDLAQLHADSVRLSPGGSGGVRFQSPPGSELAFTSEDLKATAKTEVNTGFQICSFAIPLITIVAFFVLRLFLPIVVFVFQLWFLLTLRFCIPPDVGFSGDFGAKLDSIGGGLEIDAGAVVAIEAHPDFAKNMDLMLGKTRFTPPPGGISMAAAVSDARKKKEDPLTVRSFGSIVRGVFATGPAKPRRHKYAKRVERSAVVRP